MPILLIGFALVAVVFVFWLVSLRRVVSTNEVHIIQSNKRTVSYGKDQEAGNVYYEWPSYLPVIGVSVMKLPVSILTLKLENYESFDIGRLPFVLDLVAFFRIVDSNVAAQRIVHVDELRDQLLFILKGAARTILASKTIEEILQGRKEFGGAFTEEVDDQLKAWGVSTVKNIELMDIRDSGNSSVIQDIMKKGESGIESLSRITVAENLRAAQNAEIDANREVELNRQLAEQQVGIKSAEKDQAVGIANQKAQQEIKEQQKITTEKEKEVDRVREVKTAQITKEVNLVKADENRQTDIIKAEVQKQQTVLDAEGKLEAQQRYAEGLLAEGKSKAEAESLLLLAPVDAQIKLATEIGSNKSYQEYLIKVRQVEADQVVGVEQAKSLEKADIKIIANSGTVSGGLSSLGGLFSSTGGINAGAALEGLAQSEIGQQLVNKLTGKTETKD